MRGVIKKINSINKLTKKRIKDRQKDVIMIAAASCSSAGFITADSYLPENKIANKPEDETTSASSPKASVV